MDTTLTEAEETATVPAFHPENIPTELRELSARWCVWGYVPNKDPGGKPTKPPLDPRNGLPVSNTSAWWSFETCCQAVEAARDTGKSHGVALPVGVGLSVGQKLKSVNGRGLPSRHTFAFLDLDNAVDEHGKDRPWAFEVIQQVGPAYIEYSPSGRGLRIAGSAPEDAPERREFTRKVQIDEGGGIEIGVELYVGNAARYLTFTGNVHVLSGGVSAPITPEFCDWLAKTYGGEAAGQHGAQGPGCAPDDRDLSIPQLVSGDRLEAAQDKVMWCRDGVKDWLQHGFTTESDSSRMLASAAIEVLEATVDADGRPDPALALSVLAANEFAMGVALRHRGDDKGKALVYLWEHHVKPGLRKATPVVNDFDAVEVEADVEAGAKTQVERDRAMGQHLTEDALALRFVEQHKENFRFSPGLGWLVDTGHRWEPDTRKRLLTDIRGMVRELARVLEPGEAKRLRAAKTIAAVATLAATDQRNVVDAASWDADLYLLNTPGGVVDLQTGVIRPRRADDLMMKSTIVAPSPVESAPRWLKFIDQVFGGDHEVIGFIQRLFGYCLTGSTSEQKVVFFHGAGANGKTTLIEAVMGVMGDYAVKLPSATLMHSKIERHPTELTDLQGRRLSVASEVEQDAYWNEARMKELTGDRTITARKMRSDNYQFQNTSKIIVAGNHKPNLRGGDGGVARRMVLVPFTKQFTEGEQDKGLAQVLAAERPGILSWLITGAVAWSSQGLGIPTSIERASREYLAEHDDIDAWLDERCTRGPGCRVDASVAYDDYRHWKERRGEKVPSIKTFGSRMSTVPGVSKTRSNGWKYIGFRPLAASEASDFHDPDPLR